MSAILLPGPLVAVASPGRLLIGPGPAGGAALARPDSLLSLLSPSALARAFFDALTSWVISGTAGFLSDVGGVLTTSVQPQFGPAFGQAFAEVGRIGAALALPFLLLATIQAILRQDLSMLARAALVRLPAAFVLTGAATELVSLAIGATDACCDALLAHGGTSARELVANLVTLLGGSGASGAVLSGFAGLVVAVAAVAVALVLWLELALRSVALSVATLFLPIALAGLVWSATAHWARRLAETLGALVLAKLVVVGVLVLAAGASSPQAGLGGLAQGLALLLLAVLAPYALFRLLPMIEGGAVGHLEALGQRGMRVATAGAHAATAGAHVAAAGLQWAAGTIDRMTGGGSEGSQVAESSAALAAIPWATGPDGKPPISLSDPRVEEQARIEEEEIRRRMGADSEPGEEDDHGGQ